MKTYRCPTCGTTRTTQRAYALHLLEEAGPRGITTNQLLQAGAGSRFGARVHELRHDAGYRIDEHAERYTLHGRDHQGQGFERRWWCQGCCRLVAHDACKQHPGRVTETSFMDLRPILTARMVAEGRAPTTPARREAA